MQGPRIGLTPNALQMADVRLMQAAMESPPIKGKLNPTASQPVGEFSALDLTKHLTPM